MVLLNYRPRKKRIPDPLQYYEIHHIIPKSMGGDNSPSNLVRLTGREHYIVHALLTKFTVGDAKVKMARAYIRMSGAVNNSKQFNICRKRISLLMHGKGNPAYGRQWSHCDSTIVFTDHVPDGFKKGLPYQRGGHKNYVWINNGIIETMVNRDSIPEGWSLGRTTPTPTEFYEKAIQYRKSSEGRLNQSRAISGRVSIYKDGIWKRVKPSELEYFISIGWEKRYSQSPLSKKVEIDGTIYGSIGEAATILNINKQTLTYRLNSKHQRWNNWIVLPNT